MKTVRLIHYYMRGTRMGLCVALMYRGKTLVDFKGELGQQAELQQLALIWARNQGFTHYQLGEDTLKRNTLIPTKEGEEK